ncbi:MAG: hypothetical protein E6G44_10535 [Actinobacteria bacterium]|nr:MAG: hypothetical protein E6G44_10535 [Actinomycetota bacterium]
MPDPVTVWMVHKGTGRGGVRGELILEGDRLIFRPELRTAKPDVLGETVFAMSDVDRVTRSRGSPVLELKVRTPGLPPMVLFYFVKPPDIYSSAMPNPRFAGASFLVGSNALLADDVAEWARAIRSAQRQG